MMTDKDLDDIRNGYDDDDEYDDEYDTADVYSGKGYNDREDGDDEYDDYASGRDSDEVNPHMHKIMKILTVVVIAIIVLILVFTVGKAAGVSSRLAELLQRMMQIRQEKLQFQISVV